MSEMYLIVLDDIRAAGLPKEQEGAAKKQLADLRNRLGLPPE